jgi:hypothetical protein
MGQRKRKNSLIGKLRIWWLLRKKTIHFEFWSRDQNKQVLLYKVLAKPEDESQTSFKVKIISKPIDGAEKTVKHTWDRTQLMDYKNKVSRIACN